MSTMLDKYMSVDEAAAVIHVTPGRVRQMLRSGLLKGEKIHAMAWAIDKDVVAKAAENRPPIGRPPQKKTDRSN